MLWLRFILINITFLLLTSCAAVKTVTVSPEQAIINQRADILTTRTLSYISAAVLQNVGLDEKSCFKQFADCTHRLINNHILSDSSQYATLAEIWLAYAISNADKLDKLTDENILYYFTSLRYAYAYLFLTNQTIDERALTYRQVQIRDYYNYNINIISSYLFQQLHEKERGRNQINASINGWNINIDITNLQFAADENYHLVNALTVNFKGIRNLYLRDGIGAEMVLAPNSAKSQNNRHAYLVNPYTTVTVVADFKKMTKRTVHSYNDLSFVALNPYAQKFVTLHNNTLVLTGNFTASYGLWLSNSDFAKQSLLKFLNYAGKRNRPLIYLMQPYEPKKKIILLIHGLASSPEAWVNLANDIMGDQQLRNNYQIWQIYYPTNYPIAISHQRIRLALAQTLNYVQPGLQSAAEFTNKMVVIGHSMGGIIAKMLVADSNRTNIANFISQQKVRPKKRVKAIKTMSELFNFTAEPYIERAIFIATPHYGTQYKLNKFSLWLASKIAIPLDISKSISEINKLFPAVNRQNVFIRNSIDSLSNRDPLTQYAQTLAITKNLPYHSIIGNTNQANVKLEDSDDGVVAWTSSYIPGAISDFVVKGNHFLQNSPEVVMEIRRILRQNLKLKQKK